MLEAPSDELNLEMRFNIAMNITTKIAPKDLEMYLLE